jgi:hypothetical protein
VILTQTVPTAFIHLVYGGPAVYSARATARGVAPLPLMSGYALAALKPGCDGSNAIIVYDPDKTYVPPLCSGRLRE